MNMMVLQHDRNNILWPMAVKVTLKDQLHRELCKGYAWTVGGKNVLSGRLGALGCCWHIFRDSCDIQVLKTIWIITVLNQVF